MQLNRRPQNGGHFALTFMCSLIGIWEMCLKEWLWNS